MGVFADHPPQALTLARYSRAYGIDLIETGRGDGSLVVSAGAGMLMHALDRLPEASYGVDAGGGLTLSQVACWADGLPHLVPYAFFVGTFSLAAGIGKLDALRSALGHRLYACTQNLASQNFPDIDAMGDAARRVESRLVRPAFPAPGAGLVIGEGSGHEHGGATHQKMSSRRRESGQVNTGR